MLCEHKKILNDPVKYLVYMTLIEFHHSSGGDVFFLFKSITVSADQHLDGSMKSLVERDFICIIFNSVL